jgi:peptide/nickel transport system ATP-binding protein
VALLDVSGLSVSFASEGGLVRVVQDVSFAVEAGEVLCVVGESGSGKTVTFLSILGLIDNPNVRVEGSALFKGRPVLNQGNKALRQLRGREIALISQDPMTALTPVHTIGWQIREQVQEHQPLGKRAAEARVLDLLDAVGIPNPRAAAERYPHQLSGGMRQRAVIAMALSCDPALLIADEPTTALDVTVQAQVLDLLRKLGRDFGSSIVLITHDMGVVAEMADRVLVMYAGRVVESGRCEAVFSAPLHPYTWGLLASIPPLTGPKPRRLTSIPGAPPQAGRLPPGCAFGPRCRFRFEPCAQTPLISHENGHDVACFIPAADRAAARATILASEAAPA